MPEVRVVEQTKKLVELQKVDVEIYSCKNDLKEKPAYLAQLKEQFEDKKSGFKELEGKYKSVQVKRNEHEGELQAKEDAIAKSNTQLSQIKTNKEYTAKITEMESMKADKSIIEERILVAYDETDALKVSLEKEKQFLSEEEKKYLSAKKDIEDSVKVIEDRIKVLESQRSQIVPEIEKTSLDRYEKILANKEGLAIVPVTGSSCGGCFMNVPPQVINEIQMHEKLIYCEMCARILYLEDDTRI